MSLLDERRRRIVTTHVGSLPRPPSLSAKLLARSQGQRVDAEAFGDELRTSVRAIVRQQSELDIDVVSDGEFSKISFQYYVTDRLGGIAPITPAPGRRVTRENSAFPTFYRDGSHSGTQPTRFACTGPIRYTGQTQLAADIANLKAASWVCPV
jgi:5-methyltetrahydropteroyltriglutamate--homocysteine methyltransferase